MITVPYNPRQDPPPEWQMLAEKMLDIDSGSLEDKHDLLYSRLQHLDYLVKKAKPWGGLRSSQVVGAVVQDYLMGERGR